MTHTVIDLARSEDHVYTVGGRAVPGVTGVIPYAMYKEVSREVLEDRAQHGHHVHKLIDRFFKKKPHSTDPAYMYVYDATAYLISDMIGRYGVIAQFLSSHQMYSKEFNFAGEPDLVIEFKSGRIVIIEVKTRKCYASYDALQCAGYARLAAERYKLKPSVIDRFVLEVIETNSKPKLVKMGVGHADSLILALVQFRQRGNAIAEVMSNYLGREIQVEDFLID